MEIKSLVKGPLPYKHHYNATMLGDAAVDLVLPVPQQLVEFVGNGVVTTFGDGSLGIAVDGKLVAAECPHEMRATQALTREVWQYINLALGRSGDTYQN